MIAIFGASVTQQKTGYAVKLKSTFKQKEQVKIFGYGGMHLNNAGICYIDMVLKEKPKYCFIDWFSTEYTKKDQSTIDFIDTIIYKFTKINCKLIFLFLLHEDHDDRIVFYDFCKTVLSQRNITYLDLNDYLKCSATMLRDNVHTTEFGSEKYSEEIFQKFEQIRSSIELPEQFRKTKYCSISNRQINGIFTESFKLSGNAEILGFLITIGPHSGIVRVSSKTMTSEINTWDKWCHYDRLHFNITINIKEDTIIQITDKEFDTSECKVANSNFRSNQKKFIVHSIYYLGTLQINNNLIQAYMAQLAFRNWNASSQIHKIYERLTSLYSSKSKQND